jgi:hypothetical protein
LSRNNSPEGAKVLAWFAGVLNEEPWAATVRVGLQRHEVMQKVAAAAPADAEFVNVERDSTSYWRSRRFMRPIVSMTTAALKRKRAQWLRRARCFSCADKGKVRSWRALTRACARRTTRQPFLSRSTALSRCGARRSAASTTTGEAQRQARLSPRLRLDVLVSGGDSRRVRIASASRAISSFAFEVEENWILPHLQL